MMLSGSFRPSSSLMGVLPYCVEAPGPPAHTQLCNSINNKNACQPGLGACGTACNTIVTILMLLKCAPSYVFYPMLDCGTLTENTAKPFGQAACNTVVTMLMLLTSARSYVFYPMLDCGTLAENTANLLVRLAAEAQEAKIGIRVSLQCSQGFFNVTITGAVEAWPHKLLPNHREADHRLALHPGTESYVTIMLSSQ